MAQATITSYGNAQLYSGGAGVNDGDIVLQTNDVTRFSQFMIMSTAGAMLVVASLDGVNYVTAPLSLVDLGATTTAPVLATVAGRMYALIGTYSKIQVKQTGATGVANASIMASRPSKNG